MKSTLLSCGVLAGIHHPQKYRSHEYYLMKINHFLSYPTRSLWTNRDIMAILADQVLGFYV